MKMVNILKNKKVKVTEIPKWGTFLRKQWEDNYANHLILENADILNSNDLEDEYDIYIVDKEFNWTYVKTHETLLCGPYFSRKDT